ncbi:UNVERIFIED_CONTAM: hypothetical protein HDU68_001425 [Siphonaria sp. JEL0065]|nr:hypothetical protein HDU68_001425 [Siphonaria sp. JEL0065]
MSKEKFDIFLSWLEKTPGSADSVCMTILQLDNGAGRDCIGSLNHEIRWTSRVLNNSSNCFDTEPEELVLIRGVVLNEIKPGRFLTDGEVCNVFTVPAQAIDDETLKKKGILQLMDLAYCALILYNPKVVSLVLLSSTLTPYNKGKHVFANRRAYEMWGCTEEDWRQQTLPNIHKDDFPVFSEKRLEAMKNLTRASVEVRMLCGPCTHIWTDFRPLIEKESGSLLGWMSCGIDVSEQKKREQESLDASKGLAEVQRLRAEDAEEARKLQEGFIDTICHEIRNPLNGILHCNDFINTGLLEIKSHLSKLEPNENCISVMKAVNLVLERVMDESRSTSTKMIRLDLTDFIATELVSQVAESFRAQLSAKGITHEIQFQGLLNTNPSQALVGDRVRITQIIINIFTNAIKFTQNTDVKHIKVLASVFDDDGYSPKVAFKVTIEDSGIGMTEEEKVSLFQKFQQASLKTYSEYGGSGLGLFISKNLVTEMVKYMQLYI